MSPKPVLLYLVSIFTSDWASQVALEVKNPPANAEDLRDADLIPGSGRSAGGGHGNPLQLFLPGESHGQRVWIESQRVGQD